MKKNPNYTKQPMHVKQGDTVQIISGKDKGKIGEITKIIRKKHQVVVKGINMKIKHIKAQNNNESGKINQIEAPIDSSNIMIYSKINKIRSRLEYGIDSNNGNKLRRLKKTQEILQ